MLLFDGFVGNADRHPANWGVLADASGNVRLAPVYDPAACLGAELGADNVLIAPREAIGRVHDRSERIRRYVERCPSGFGDETRLVALAHVLEELRQWPEAQRLWAPLLTRFASAMSDAASFLGTIPEGWLSATRRRLALDLLAARLRFLEENAL